MPTSAELSYAKQLNDHLKVCKCGYHMRLTAREWLSLLDSGSFIEADSTLAPSDPLNFVSAKDNYAKKLLIARQKLACTMRLSLAQVESVRPARNRGLRIYVHWWLHGQCIWREGCARCRTGNCTA